MSSYKCMYLVQFCFANTYVFLNLQKYIHSCIVLLAIMNFLMNLTIGTYSL